MAQRLAWTLLWDLGGGEADRGWRGFGEAIVVPTQPGVPKRAEQLAGHGGAWNSRAWLGAPVTCCAAAGGQKEAGGFRSVWRLIREG